MEMSGQLVCYPRLEPETSQIHKGTDRGSGLSEKNFLGPSKRGEPAKNVYTKLEGLTLSHRVAWAWSERVNLCSQQTVIVPRRTKAYAT